MSPSEANHGDLGQIDKKDLLLVFSYSGNTSELNNMLKFANRFKIKIIHLNLLCAFIHHHHKHSCQKDEHGCCRPGHPCGPVRTPATLIISQGDLHEDDEQDIGGGSQERRDNNIHLKP